MKYCKSKNNLLNPCLSGKAGSPAEFNSEQAKGGYT